MEGQTATNPQTGEKVVLRGGQWVPMGASQPSGAPGVIPGRPKAPDPYKVQQDAESDARADANLNLSQQGNVRSTNNQVQDYRKEYQSLPEVKTYSTALTSLSNAVKRAPDANGDTALIYDYAKALDPESVVRESEVAMAQSASPLVQTLLAKLKKEFGYEEGGQLSPEGRAYIKREIFNSAMTRRNAYEQRREFFSELARRAQYDPYDVVGPDFGEPYREELSRFSQKGYEFTPEQMAARNGGGLPTEQPSESLLNPLPGERLGELNTDALGPGDKFLFDENGTPIAIQSRDGTVSGYSQVVDEVSQRKSEAELRSRGQDQIDRAESGQAGLSKGVTLNLSDEITGAVGGLGELLSGGSFTEGYTRERDVERAAQRISEEKKGIRPEILGGLLTPGLGVLGPAKTAGQFAKQGAALGGVAGFGAGEGMQDSIGKGALGSGVGAAGGAGAYGAGRGVNALMQTPAGQRISSGVASAINSRRPSVDREVIEAGARQGVPIRLADAVEGKRPALAALEKTATGSPKVARAYGEDVAATQSALGRVAPQGGTARDNSTLGKMLQGAMERNNTQAKAQTSALFSRVEKIAPGASGDGAQTIKFIDDEIARLNAAGPRGNASSVKALQDIRDDIAETGLSVSSLQSLRASVRQRAADNGLDRNASQAMFGRVDEAATKELEGVLAAADPRAVGAFRNANRSHAERLAFQREVARELRGTPNNPLDAEKAAMRLMAKIGEKGDEAGFGRVWQSLDKAERDDLAATMLERISGGEEFSLAKLATGLEGANERTLRTVFGKDGAEALRDIRLIARRKTQTAKGLNNSNTGSVVEAKGNSLLDTVLGVFGYTQGGPLGAVTAVAARSGGEKVSNSWRARLLLNPDFTKWLRQTPATSNPAVINRHFERLNKIASREQSFLMDAQALQDFLRQQFSEGVGRAAATGDNPEDNRGK